MEEFDVVIIGAGPGGLQLALSLEEIRQNGQADLRFCILEKEGGPGAFFRSYPVHGRLISNNKLYSGADARSRFAERFDWNSLVTRERSILTRNYSRDFYPSRQIVPDMLEDLCAHYSLPVRYDEAVRGVSRRDDGRFLVRTDGAELIARYVVVATGLKPLSAPIAGIALATPYAEMAPAEQYRDKRVLIIGKGNSGFECAMDILNEAATIMMASPHPVRLAYQTHYVGNVRSINAMLVENYQLKHNAAILDCQIELIEKVGDTYNVRVAYTHANDEAETLCFDAVIAATGFTGNLDALDGTVRGPLLHGKFPDIDGEFGCRGVDGLYFAGALTHGPDYRSFSSSGFIHGFRYNSIVLANHLAAMLDAADEPEPVAGEALLDVIMTEFEEDAAIYLQPGYIGRCFMNTPDGAWLDLGLRTRRWFDDQPAASEDTLLLATLEYGDIHAFPDVLRIERFPGEPDRSVHIHPVVRTRGRGEAGEVHFEESLLNRFGGNAATRGRLARVLETAGGGHAGLMAAG